MNQTIFSIQVIFYFLTVFVTLKIKISLTVIVCLLILLLLITILYLYYLRKFTMVYCTVADRFTSKGACLSVSCILLNISYSFRLRYKDHFTVPFGFCILLPAEQTGNNHSAGPLPLLKTIIKMVIIHNGDYYRQLEIFLDTSLQ